MTKKTSDEAELVLALLDDSADHDQSAEDANAELIADGVNVSAFLSRAQAAVNEVKKEERLSWRKEATQNTEAFANSHDVQTSMFAAMTRAQLEAEALQSADRVHFKNLAAVTDDDLRTLLADRARLKALAKK